MKNGITTTTELLCVRLTEGSVAGCCREEPFTCLDHMQVQDG